ncbi:hypothetical protein, partial [Desulfonatronospira sp.]|uniref:hypothetical protein n=1 Tax=Desulfonatronospira sp. TaxID=1962951 RepID=UPI0025C466A9
MAPPSLRELSGLAKVAKEDRIISYRSHALRGSVSGPLCGHKKTSNRDGVSAPGTGTVIAIKIQTRCFIFKESQEVMPTEHTEEHGSFKALRSNAYSVKFRVFRG